MHGEIAKISGEVVCGTGVRILVGISWGRQRGEASCHAGRGALVGMIKPVIALHCNVSRFTTYMTCRAWVGRIIWWLTISPTASRVGVEAVRLLLL